ncbi:MAG TPA: HEAT repeat domain-containing protein [Verrucomicrobiae bacterium]|jgi:hypothetical protein|nr:HEAT repeat domain-containing protein [Verrucomicrobiae bacterium]
MRKRRVIVGCGLIAVIAAVAMWIFHPREPVVEGRRLGDWIEMMQTDRSRVMRDQARMVVRQLDTNNVAVLLKWRDEEPTDKINFKERIASWYGRLSVLIARHGFGRGLPSWAITRPYARMDHSSLAMWALPELGPAAREFAIRGLIERLPNTNEWIMGSAWLSLEKLAPDSIPPLHECLANTNAQVLALAVSALGDIGDLSAVPLATRLLQDTNMEVAITAAETLGKLGTPPSLFLPVVVRGLKNSTDPEEISYELQILTRYPDAAQSAVPVLREILDRTHKSTNGAEVREYGETSEALRILNSTNSMPTPK